MIIFEQLQIAYMLSGQNDLHRISENVLLATSTLSADPKKSELLGRLFEYLEICLWESLILPFYLPA